MDLEKEYITKQYVYSVLEKMRKINNKNQGGLISDTVEVCIRCVSDNIRLAHEEDVAPVRHGQWNVGADGWECSECTIESNNTYPICPYCGALMDKDGDGE